jgi:Na+/melibiose symporter-like transporter
MGLSPLVKMIVIGVLIFLFKTCVTIFVTPYSALGAELSDDYHERVKIQAVKTVFFLMALVLVSAICMFVFFRPRPGYPIGQLNPSAYSEMAVTGSIIMILTGLWTYHSTKAYKHKKSQQERYDIRTSFVSSFKNADFRQVFLGYLTTNTASAIISGVGLHTFTYTFLMTNVEIGIIFGVQFLVSIITQPFWASVSKKIDKKKTVLVCLIIAMIGTLMLLGFVYNRDFVRLHPMSMVIYAITVGFGTSGLYSIPLAMVADTVDMEEYKNGYRCEGMFYGLLNFGYKIAQSIAILLLGVLLDVIGFDPNVYIQTSATEFRLGALLAIGSMVAFMLSFIAYRSYSLNYDIVTDIQEKLAFKQV